MDEGDTGEDGDSALGDDQASSTASITSSILKYRTINGRTYHSERGNSQHWYGNCPVHTLHYGRNPSILYGRC